MQSISLLGENPHPCEQEIREGLEGNLCRCTGYQNIVEAVRVAAASMSAANGSPGGPPAEDAAPAESALSGAVAGGAA